MKKDKSTDRISTFIGEDASIEGKIDFKGTIRVDGRVKGNITSNGGTVVVGEKGVVNAEMSVNAAVVMGEVNGTIDALERIEVYPSGRLEGNIQSPIVTIEPGGIFNGNCVMKPDKVSGTKSSFFLKKPSEDDESKEK